MELEAKLAEIAKVVRDHREVLLTEEAAKNALVMPFLQALGYNVFNPSEVIPEFTCDVGIKKGEKVDYAICNEGKVSILVECKPASSDLTINHASQLFRYFSVTDARVAILTNGVIFKFFSDIDNPNKMDSKPFFTLDMDGVKKGDIRTLANFMKGTFNIDTIVAEAGHLKMQSLVAKELEKEFADPSEEFIRLIANRVHEGRVTASIKESFKTLIVASISNLIRDKVNERLTSALHASNPGDSEEGATPATLDSDGVITTQDEIDGFNIVRAIGSRSVDPSRIVLRDAKSYCAILLDDNNRKPICRLHFNRSQKYLGVFDKDKNETRIPINGVDDIYAHSEKLIETTKSYV
jgi:hypothetical protein